MIDELQSDVIISETWLSPDVLKLEGYIEYSIKIEQMVLEVYL